MHIVIDVGNIYTMKRALADYHYNFLLDNETRELRTLEKYKKVNEYLKINDWLFISPIFFQGYELDIFLKLSESTGNEKSKILDVISKKFYDLRRTALFIEGYCVRCNFIRPFSKSIEHSLILTFQRDYEGSIKTIIPIIEGILRKYLIEEKSCSNERIQFKTIKNSFDNLKDDLIQISTDHLRSYKTENNIVIEFSEDQIQHLVQLDSEYYNTWFSFVDDFVKQSFYLKTSGQTLTNEVNRHSILHEFGFDFEYNFENYIKVYFLLQFLTWVFLLKEGKSLLNDIGNYRYFEKIVAYNRIIKKSRKLLYDKYILTKEYDRFNDASLKQNFPEFKNDVLPSKHRIIHRLLRKFDEFLWRRNLK